MKNLAPILVLALCWMGCSSKDNPNPFDPNAPKPSTPSVRTASIGIVGDTTDVTRNTSPGVVIMGGGADVDAAFQWMISRSGGGDVVIIRATGTDAYNAYVNRLGQVNSVETLKIDSRKLADDEGVARIIRNAEMLFIAGGDQSDYTNYWKGTKVMEAINYLLNEKKVPVGGTSAGAAVLGNFYYSGDQGSVTSAEALANPYHTKITLGQADFLRVPYLQNVITDQHFFQRDRQGRMIAFLGRIMMDWSKVPFGIAVDERTAVCIDHSGIATVVGSNTAYFIKTESAKLPENFVVNSAIHWHRDGKAIQVTAIPGTASSVQFNTNTFEPSTSTGISQYWWSVTNGVWTQAPRP